MATSEIELFVRLLNEGTEVIRPATGTFVGRDVIRLQAPVGYDPADEEWEFPPGSEVVCVAEVWGGRQILVARSRALAPTPTG